METCGSMEKFEKTEFILEQIRLVLDRSDYVRTNMMARKIDAKLLESEDMQVIIIRLKIFIHLCHTLSGP